MKGNVTTILRGFKYEQVRSVCNVLVKSKKIKNVEITLNTPDVYETLKKICKEYEDELFVGAGTVITFEELKKAISCGVKFVLSPTGYTKEMIDYCHEKGVIAIPSGLTPTEILTQFQYGADVVKVFPANEFSKTYAKKVCEPLGNYPLMAVGGVNANNVHEHFEGGYQYVGTAWGLFRKVDVIEMNEEKMLECVVEFESKM